MKKIIIGTRGSDLALWQANYTKELLEEKGCEVEIKIIETSGDKSQEWNTSFDKLEGKGFFTKELEDALLKKEIDLAVHSHKDLLTTNPEGLIIAGVSKRANPSELLLIKRSSVDPDKQFSLKKGAIVGTSSARRKSQLLAFRPDVKLEDLRGNVPTRIKKLKEGNMDAILIAMAGPERLELDLSEFHEEVIDPKVFVPAPAQGVLAWQIREDDDDLFNKFDDLTDIDVQTQVRIERGVLSLMDGGCQLPLGVHVDTEFDHEDRPVFNTSVSIARKWDDQPVQLFIATGNSEDLPERIVNHFNNLKPQKVFVTKEFREKDYLPSALGRLKFDVLGKSLIEFKEIKIRFLPTTEWIFFSSKHAVRYFMQQKPDFGKVKFGCIGSSTSAELRTFGHRAEFIGQGTDTKLIGKQFASKVGSSRVLFPIAKDSMRTVQWQMPKSDNAVDLNVYFTVKHSIELDPSFTILVFTSPSNVEAFLEKNKILPHQKVIAMGDATEQAFRKLKLKDITKPASFDDLGLVQAILARSI